MNDFLINCGKSEENRSRVKQIRYLHIILALHI